MIDNTLMISKEYNFKNLCYLIQSRQDLNVRRLNYLARAYKIQEKWSGFNNRSFVYGGIFHTNIYGGIWEEQLIERDNSRIWIDAKFKKQYDDFYNKSKKIGALMRKRTKRIKKIRKKLNLQLYWGRSWNIMYILMSNTVKIANKNKIKSIANEYKIEKAIEDILLT